MSHVRPMTKAAARAKGRISFRKSVSLYPISRLTKKCHTNIQTIFNKV